MNCAAANQVDMVQYLSLLGHQPQKINGADHWYLSPLQDEKNASFKVNTIKNKWYDHSLGTGGKTIDFAVQYFKCSVAEALDKIASFQQQNGHQKPIETPPFHLQKNAIKAHTGARETAIQIIAAKKPINDLMLCRYLKDRKINRMIADKFCHEVAFTINEKPTPFRAIGFENNSGGFELRNAWFKSSNSPKDASYIHYPTAEKVTVFEGFFDFLSYQTIHQDQLQEPSNFLVLNSLSFFEKSLALMEKNSSIHLYLDNDSAGQKWTNFALERSLKFKDESALYKPHKDLNDWLVNFGKLIQKSNMGLKR